MLGLVLALSSSVCWGVSDFIGGVQSRRVPLLQVLLVSETVGLIGLLAVLLARGTPAPALPRLLPAIGGGLAGTVALASFYRALAIGTMSIVAPISATGVAVPVIVGVASGDRPSWPQWAGILVAVIGVILASREHGPGVPERRAGTASVVLALVAALGFGAFFVGLRASARADVLWALLASRGASLLALLPALALLRPTVSPWRGALWPIAAVGLLDVTANTLYAIATRHGLLSVVAVGASLYPLATVVLARLVLGERVRRIQEVGIVAAIAGVALIAAGS